MTAWEVFETVCAGALVLFLLLGWVAIDVAAEWNRNRRKARSLRSRSVDPSPCPERGPGPRSVSPVPSRITAGRGARPLSPEATPGRAPSLSRWW